MMRTVQGMSWPRLRAILEAAAERSPQGFDVTYCESRTGDISQIAILSARAWEATDFEESDNGEAD